MSAWTTAPNKSAVRTWQLDAPIARRALFLPGWDLAADDGCACLREAMRNGLVGPGTQVVAVERDPALARKVEDRMAGMGLSGRMRMHADELSRLRLDPADPVDFAFVDLLGNLDGETSLWIRDELAPALAEGATLSFTFAYGLRANRFLRKCQAAFEGRYEGLLRAAAGHFGVNDRLVLLGLLATASALRGWGFTFAGAVHYRDSVRSMVGIRLDGLARDPGPSPWPVLEDIAGLDLGGFVHRGADDRVLPKEPTASDQGLGSLIMHLSDVPRTLAGRRPGHVAQADALARDLLRVVTGYDGAAPDARSEAARKAWRTRRARGWVHPRARTPFPIFRPPGP